VGDDSWSPTVYERFAAEREQPFWDLLALVEPTGGGVVIDLGCGSGELTRSLHERSGATKTVALVGKTREVYRRLCNRIAK